MSKKGKYPRLSPKEAKMETSLRACVDYSTVKRVLDAYFDVCAECIINGVEVEMEKFAVLKVKEYEPKYNCVKFNMFTKEPMPPADYPGFIGPNIRIKIAFKKKIKEATKYFDEGKGEEQDAVGE